MLHWPAPMGCAAGSLSSRRFRLPYSLRGPPQPGPKAVHVQQLTGMRAVRSDQVGCGHRRCRPWSWDCVVRPAKSISPLRGRWRDTRRMMIAPINRAPPSASSARSSRFGCTDRSPSRMPAAHDPGNLSEQVQQRSCVTGASGFSRCPRGDFLRPPPLPDGRRGARAAIPQWTRADPPDRRCAVVDDRGAPGTAQTPPSLRCERTPIFRRSARRRPPSGRCPVRRFAAGGGGT